MKFNVYVEGWKMQNIFKNVTGTNWKEIQQRFLTFKHPQPIKRLIIIEVL